MNYDKLKVLTLTERKSSTIINLRNANNKVKSWLIRSFLPKHSDVAVLDIGCGKGGDLYKFLNCHQVQVYTGFDVSEKLINIAKDRLTEFKGNSKKKVDLFSCDFLNFDKWYDPVKMNDSFHFINMQFCIHYFMTTPSVVSSWIQIISSVLKKKGRLVITCVDQENLNKKIEGGKEWKNSLCHITPLSEEQQSRHCWRGYHFHLEEAVSDVEFIVDTRYLESQFVANKLQLISKSKFSDISLSPQFRALTKDEQDIFELYHYLVFEKV
jgi:SAM-dependent methyltransferase